MEYRFTIGERETARALRVEEDSEILDSLVIVLDRLLELVVFDEDVLDMVLNVLPTGARRELVRRCNELFSEEERIELSRIERMKSRSLSRQLFSAAGEAGAAVPGHMGVIAQDVFYSHFTGRTVEDRLARKASELMQIFEIGETEVRLLAFLYLIQSVGGLDDVTCANSIAEFHSLTAAIYGLPLKDVRVALSERSSLTRLGLIEPDYLPPPHFQVDEMVKRFFRTGSVDVFLENLHPVDGHVYPVDSFSVSAIQRETITSLLRSGQRNQLLLYGTPGTGKTEFAKSIVRDAGLNGFFLTSVDERGGGERGGRILQLQAISKKLDPEGAILIVDEADHLLNSEGLFSTGTEKGWLTDFIDSAAISIIWISNSIDETHEAVLRRFTYSLQFRPTSGRTREQTWNRLVKRSGLSRVLDAETIRSLSREYKVNVGGISGALDAVAGLHEQERLSKDVLLSRLRELLGQHQQLIGDQHAGGLKPLNAAYDPDILNTDIPVERIVTALNRYVALTGHRGGENRMEGPEEEAPVGVKGRFPFNLLLWGEPGTGKTEFAKYLADRVDRPLHITRASSLLSAWVGKTEENIDTAFREAEESKSVLFIDEADSFFVSRGGSRQSWENSQTNELLTQMENFEGILICSTNLLDIMDHAVMRRFSWKVRFSPLSSEGRVRLYARLFGGEGELSGRQRMRLEKMDGLTPGDFYTVQMRYFFSHTAVGSRVHDELLEALEQELSYKSRSRSRQIGFVG